MGLLAVVVVFALGPIGAMWLVSRLVPDRLWGVAVVVPAVYLVVLAAAWPAGAQDLDDPFFSEGYAAHWDSAERAEWREARGLPRSPVPKAAKPVAVVEEAVSGAEVDFDEAMRAMYAEREAQAQTRGGVVYGAAMAIPDGTCRYVELHGRRLLVKARSPWAIDVTGLWEPGVKHHEAWNCPGGVVR